jgi:hypothetical protein
LTDGHKPYLEAVENAFGSYVDYAMLVKHYGAVEGTTPTETKYSPNVCTGCRKEKITDGPTRN